MPQSTQINYLGYEVLDPPTRRRARVAGWGRLNLLWVVLVVSGLSLYLIGGRKARRLGRDWPLTRGIFLLAGLGLTGYLAVSGLWSTARRRSAGTCSCT